MDDDDLLANSLVALDLEGQLPILAENASDSENTLNEAREWITAEVPTEHHDGVDVVVLGSYARLEASGVSDFDYLVVVHSLPDDVRTGRLLLEAADAFIETKLVGSGSSKRPGQTGLFGQIASAVDLTERIGLEQDTNLSHSRRLLILEESRSIYRPDLHERLIKTICARYLIDYQTPKPGPPRFLLNDVIRYWFTLAVDYQAKRWQGAEGGWGLRYLKLLNSRKIAYAGTLASLLRCSEDNPATVEYLHDEFLKRPLTRLAQLALDADFDGHGPLKDALLHAERFATFLADGDLREKVKSIRSPAEAETLGEFQTMREAADDLQDSLQRVFFESSLASRAKHYLAF